MQTGYVLSPKLGANLANAIAGNEIDASSAVLALDTGATFSVTVGVAAGLGDTASTVEAMAGTSVEGGFTGGLLTANISAADNDIYGVSAGVAGGLGINIDVKVDSIVFGLQKHEIKLPRFLRDIVKDKSENFNDPNEVTSKDDEEKQ